MKSLSTRKLVLTAVLACLAFVLNTFVWFPAMAPFQHFVNALSAVFVGPWYGAAAGFLTGVMRMLCGRDIGSVVGAVFGPILGVVWGLAALAITLTAIDMRKYSVFSMICYISMGWCILVKVPLLIQAVGWGGFWLILLGGVCYTIGAVLYGMGRKKRYMHSIFHLFVVAGSILHLLAVLLYAI